MGLVSKTTLTWNATPEGYERSDGAARLVRGARKSWSLVLPDGRAFALPKRASFDHADGVMAEVARLGLVAVAS